MEALKLKSADVSRYLDENLDTILTELMDLVRIPSVQEQALPGEPFGKGPAQALEAAAKLYESYGFTVERHADRGYAVVAEGTGERSIGVFCHCDVVPANGNWKYTSAFAPVIRGDVLIGRGVKDNKGGVIATLHALKALQSAGVKLKNQIRVVLGSNEETGMEDIESFVNEQPIPDFSLVPDCEFPICRGEKSYCHFETRSLVKFDEILDFYGGFATNAVCGEATVVLRHSAALEEELRVAVAMRSDAVIEINQQGNIVLRAKGISAHAAAPEGSVNAGGVAASILLQCPSINDHDRAILKKIHQMLDDYLGNYFDISYEDEAFKQLTTVCGIIRTENGCVKLNYAINYNTILKVEDIWTKVEKKLTDMEWTFSQIDDSCGFLKEKNHPAVKLMNETYLAMLGEQEREIYTTRAGTYARMLNNAYAVGVDVPKTMPPEEFPKGHGLVHQPDECISIPGFMAGIRMLAMMLLAADQHLEELV